LLINQKETISTTNTSKKQPITMQQVSKWMDNEEYLGKYFIISLVGLSQGVLALSEVPLNFLYKDDFHMSPAQVTIA